MQSSELESGKPDEAEQESIVFFLLGGHRELNSNLMNQSSLSPLDNTKIIVINLFMDKQFNDEQFKNEQFFFEQIN